MFDHLWGFLSDPANRAVLGWIGSGVVVVATGIWAVLKFFASKPDSKPASTTVSASGGSIAAGGNITNAKIDNRSKQ